LAALILILLAALVAPARRRVRSPRPAHRHIVVRIVCGALALAADVAVGYFTWRDVDRVYARGDDAPLQGATRSEVSERQRHLLEERPANEFGYSRPRHTAPSLALAEHIGGTAALLLLAAAALGALVFRGRMVALTVLLAAMVLYAAALDRLVLRAHLGVLTDAAAPVAERVLAADLSVRTFFYYDTAAEALRDVSDDAAVPAPVRSAAKGAAIRLQAGTP
jgi:hypothetical protein